MANAGPPRFVPPTIPLNTPITITRNRRDFSVIFYHGQLFRADAYSFARTTAANPNAALLYVPHERTNVSNTLLSTYSPTMNVIASELYGERPIKYFTPNKEEVKRIYVPLGAPYLYTWQTNTPLLLLNMTDADTRNNVLELLGTENNKNAIRTAFKEESGQIKRYSSPKTQRKNDLALQSICDLGFDGYYTPAYNYSNTNMFHSEIGLCASAFHKLRLVSVDKYIAPLKEKGWIPGKNPTAKSERKKTSSFISANIIAAAAAEAASAAAPVAAETASAAAPVAAAAANNNFGFLRRVKFTRRNRKKNRKTRRR